MTATTAGCGLFNADELLTFRVPLTYELPVTIPIAYPSADRLAQLRAENERSFPIQSYIPVNLGEVDDRLRGSQLVEEVRIEGITVTVVSNTLEDVDLQPFEVRVGEPGLQVLAAELAGDTYDSALVIGDTAVIEAQAPPFTGSVAAEIVTENQTPAAEQIAGLEFGLGIGTSLILPEGELTSGGRADVRLTLELVFVIRPL